MKKEEETAKKRKGKTTPAQLRVQKGEQIRCRIKGKSEGEEWEGKDKCLARAASLGDFPSFRR